MDDGVDTTEDKKYLLHSLHDSLRCFSSGRGFEGWGEACSCRGAFLVSWWALPCAVVCSSDEPTKAEFWYDRPSLRALLNGREGPLSGMWVCSWAFAWCIWKVNKQEDLGREYESEGIKVGVPAEPVDPEI